tara:strand:+ start:204 stop:584 length:381 start_codon:yes stop_codon:yes gene_type:complete
MNKQIKFAKGIVNPVMDKNNKTGIDILLTPEDIKNFSTEKGYVPVSIRLGKDGKYYAYKSTHRIAPTKEIVDDVYDLARIAIEEVPHHDLDAVSEALHMQEYKQGKKETVHINEVINKVNKEWKSR